MEKMCYESPQLRTELLGIEDIITTSTPGDNGIIEDKGENDGEWIGRKRQQMSGG